jgi:hypothetical protein
VRSRSWRRALCSVCALALACVAPKAQETKQRQCDALNALQRGTPFRRGNDCKIAAMDDVRSSCAPISGAQHDMLRIPISVPRIPPVVPAALRAFAMAATSSDRSAPNSADSMTIVADSIGPASNF